VLVTVSRERQDVIQTTVNEGNECNEESKRMSWTHNNGESEEMSIHDARVIIYTSVPSRVFATEPKLISPKERVSTYQPKEQ
jgi:hypothetical protein